MALQCMNTKRRQQIQTSDSDFYHITNYQVKHIRSSCIFMYYQKQTQYIAVEVLRLSSNTSRSTVTNETQSEASLPKHLLIQLKKTRISSDFRVLLRRAAVSMPHSEITRSTNACEAGALIKSWAIGTSLLVRMLLFGSQNRRDSIPPISPLKTEPDGPLKKSSFELLTYESQFLPCNRSSFYSFCKQPFLSRYSFRFFVTIRSRFYSRLIT